MAMISSFYTNLRRFLSFIRNFFVVKPKFNARKIFSRRKDECRGRKSEKQNPITVTETSSWRPNWAELQKDVMELIIMRLNPRDTIRLKSVCKSWRSLLLQNKIRKYPLLVLPQDRDSKHLSCVCISDGTICNMKLPESIGECRYLGSSKGWLFMAEKKITMFDLRKFRTKSETYTHMFNPDSGKVLQLPLLTTICLLDENNPSQHVYKIEVSSPDPLNCVVAATFIIDGGVVILAMCKPESKQWTVFDLHDLDLIDVLFLNGELCVLCEYDESQDIKRCTFKITDGEEVSMRIIPYSDLEQDPMPQLLNLHGQFKIITNHCLNIYLAESTNGELFLIRRFYDKLMAWPADQEEIDELEDFEEFVEQGRLEHLACCKTTKFDVFTVDFDNGNLLELKSIGDQVVFVHQGGSPVVCTSSYPETESNCIYFTQDMPSFLYKWNSREMGIYKMDDGRICRCFPSVPNPFFAMGWMTIETHSNNPFYDL